MLQRRLLTLRILGPAINMSTTTLRRSARIPTSTKKPDEAIVIDPPKPKAPAPKKRPQKASTTKPSLDEPAPVPLAAPANTPTTPLRKKRKTAAKSPNGTTTTPPTAAAAAAATSPARPASPHATNAPLASPSGAVTASAASPAQKRKAATALPDMGAMRPASATVETVLADAEAFLVRVDPKLKTLVDKHRCDVFTPEGLREVVVPFEKLASGIIGQQVSGQAASSIRKKFTALFPSTHPAFPSPAQVLTLDIATLRTAGLSQRKAEYIRGLAEKFASGELSTEMLVQASDAELIEKLVAVRGLGQWSVEMFACFGLKRLDVFSTGDLGVQRGMAVYVGRDVSKLKAKGGKWKYMSEKEMLDIASRFSPYRSLFMWYMWRIEDVDVSVLSG